MEVVAFNGLLQLYLVGVNGDLRDYWDSCLSVYYFAFGTFTSTVLVKSIVGSV